MNITRRTLLQGSAIVGVAGALGVPREARADSSNPAEIFEIALRQVHNPEEVAVLRDDYLAATGATKRALGDAEVKAAVGAIYAWFYGRGYLLSAELVAHARSNMTVDSLYSPLSSNINPLRNTKAVAAIKQGKVGTGSSSFSLRSSVVEADAYYSIHKFNFQKTAIKVRLTDRYDYNDQGHYNTITTAAVQTMYEAQKRGIIKPFKLNFLV